ncbi:MAG: MBOAT family protein [Magnetococcales bacterium]|nr:MBOAT family protein [Magnetococcales bacterium]
MAFSTYIFLLLFLPVTLAGFYVIYRFFPRRWRLIWLVVLSFVFYAYWSVSDLFLVLTSIALNYALVQAMNVWRETYGRFILFIGVSVNLVLLGYFKYIDFFISNINKMFDWSLSLPEVILPLGISFYTFQQIAFLVDHWKGRIVDINILNYCLCICFFPHLIAGPIIDPKEILSQFDRKNSWLFRWNHLSVGLTLFVVGLAKKVLIADSIGVYADKIFFSAAGGMNVPMLEAWAGVLAYTFQIYFDFSGYSDMAVGLARMFGIRFPQNFNSPYQAVDLIEFWRRWHITLSRFLRNHVYIPLGGNRQGKLASYRNIFITMTLGGLWHGASWTYVFWGMGHGVCLVLNHAWRSWGRWRLPDGLSRFITLLAVMFGWVLFRADTMTTAINIFKSLFGLNGIFLHQKWIAKLGLSYEYVASLGIEIQDTYTVINTEQALGWELFLLAVVLWVPNIYTWMSRYSPTLQGNTLLQAEESRMLDRFKWYPHPVYSLILAVLTVWSLTHIDQGSSFLYFQF